MSINEGEKKKNIPNMKALKSNKIKLCIKYFHVKLHLYPSAEIVLMLLCVCVPKKTSNIAVLSLYFMMQGRVSSRTELDVGKHLIRLICIIPLFQLLPVWNSIKHYLQDHLKHGNQSVSDAVPLFAIVPQLPFPLPLVHTLQLSRLSTNYVW